MTDKEIKKLVLKWGQQIGEHRAKGILVGRRVSTSVVDQLFSERYESEIRGTNLTVIEDELRKAGLLPSQEEAV